MSNPAYLVVMTMRIQPSEYYLNGKPVDPSDQSQVREIVQGILQGDASMPNECEIKVYREVNS